MERTPDCKTDISKNIACLRRFSIIIKGNSAYGLIPQHAIDPIAISAQILNGIYMINARELDALSPAAISVCMIHGGSVPDIIPKEVEMEGIFWAVDLGVGLMIANRIEEIVIGYCRAYGAGYEYSNAPY